MKVVILAGGLGTRLAEETDLIPKPMVEIGGRPIIWHIMRHYAHYGHCEFVIALGFKANVVKQFMLNYRALSHNRIAVDFANGDVLLDDEAEPLDWNVHLIDTGLHTMTAGRVRRVLPVVGNETFMLTYGDGVSDVDLDALTAFHRSHGKLATITVVRPPTHFGYMQFDGDQIVEFVEKPRLMNDWINGGFMVMEPGVAEYLGDDETVLENAPLERLAKDGELMAFRHTGFWQCMDSLRHKRLLEEMWESGHAPWRTWA